MEYDGSGQMIRRYAYGPGIDEPICMKTGAATYFYHFNALGSVIALSNASGDLTETYAYSPYGKVNQASSVGNPYRFTGRRYDPETGSYYYRARYYDPEIGRFLQVDPIGYVGGINLYGYVSNNSVNLTDPLGLFGERGWFGTRPTGADPTTGRQGSDNFFVGADGQVMNTLDNLGFFAHPPEKYGRILGFIKHSCHQD